jgi:hypothetical protein
MDYQLSELTVQELTLRHDLAETKDVLSLAALEDWESQARQYISDLRASLEWLDAIPQNDEERRQQFEMKRQIVKSLVEKIVIEKDRNLRVVFHLDVVTLLERAGMTAEIDSVGIYTRVRPETRPSFPLSPPRRSVCGVCAAAGRDGRLLLAG